MGAILDLDDVAATSPLAKKELAKMRGLLLWALYHHQGGHSTIGQPIRKVLGIGMDDALTDKQIEEAQIAAGVLVPHNAVVSSGQRGDSDGGGS